MEGYRLFLDIDFGDFALRYIGCTSINLTPSVPCLNRYNCPYTKGNRFDKIDKKKNCEKKNNIVYF